MKTRCRGGAVSLAIRMQGGIADRFRDGQLNCRHVDGRALQRRADLVAGVSAAHRLSRQAQLEQTLGFVPTHQSLVVPVGPPLCASQRGFGAGEPGPAAARAAAELPRPVRDVLLLQWSTAAPPTSITTSRESLQLIDRYTDGRGFFDDPVAWAGQDSNLRLTDYESGVCRAFDSGKRFSGQARRGCRAFDRPSWEHAGNTTGDRAVAHPRCAAPRAAAGLLETNARERDPSGGPTLWPHERLLELAAD